MFHIEKRNVLVRMKFFIGKMKILEQIIKTTKLSHKNFALPNIFLLCSLLRRRGTLEAFNNFYYFFKKRNLFLPF